MRTDDGRPLPETFILHRLLLCEWDQDLLSHATVLGWALADEPLSQPMIKGAIGGIRDMLLAYWADEKGKPFAEASKRAARFAELTEEAWASAMRRREHPS